MNQSMNRSKNTSRPVARPATTAPVPAMQEYSIRMADKSNKQHHLMKFNYNLNVNFDKWSSVKMERENNLKNFKGFQQEEQPKFGAGSEYNREAKEEARRKKYGINIKKYNADAQPWILEDGNKKFRGTREGGIGDNSSYYVFAHNEDGTITAHKLEEWYSFQPIQRYKPLSAEQAEEEFARRTNCVNKWSMKLKMQLNANNGEEAEEAEETKSKKKGSKLSDKISSLKISDKDEFMNSSDESSSDDDNDDKKPNDESKAKQKKAKGKAALAKKKKKDRDLDDEAGEESDDGDQEGRECEYIESSDSDSEPETETVKNQLKSVEEEKDTFSSDDDSDDEKVDKEKTEAEKKEKLEKDNKMVDMLNDSPVKEVKEVKQVKEYRSKRDIFNDAMNKTPGTGNKSDFSSDSDEEDVKPAKSHKKDKKDKKDSKDRKESKDKKHHSKSSKSSAVGTEKTSSEDSNKRKASTSPLPVAKKIKTETSAPAPVATASPFAMFNKDSNGLNEEAVRRYLVRKPMTTTELITKFRKLKTVPKESLVETMTSILKKINPNRQTIQGKMYLSLKEM
ncbi:unnamed protein product [Diamesa hyperborea]